MRARKARELVETKDVSARERRVQGVHEKRGVRETLDAHQMREVRESSFHVREVCEVREVDERMRRARRMRCVRCEK